MNEIMNTKNNDLVYILILNYNSARETIECVESIIKYVKYANYKIIILDNNSQDNSCVYLNNKIKDISKEYNVSICLIENSTNYGYAYGNNIGIKKALLDGAKYICIVNPDIVATEDFLSELVNQLSQDNKIGMICPAVVSDNNATICTLAGAEIGNITGYTRLINSGKKLSEINPKLYKCDYLGGMCVLVRKEVIDKIGYIPENYFLFYEETEWCIKSNNVGYKCVSDANVSVIHKGSVTIDRASKGKINMHNYYMYRNRIIFQKRNRSKAVYYVFLIYYLAEIAYERIKGHYTKEVWAAYIDGVLDKDRLNNVFRGNK